MKLTIGGDTREHPEIREFRAMSSDEVRALQYGERVWFIANDCTARQVKIAGQRQSGRVEILVKCGLYEYVTFTYPGENRLLISLGER